MLIKLEKNFSLKCDVQDHSAFLWERLELLKISNQNPLVAFQTLKQRHSLRRLFSSAQTTVARLTEWLESLKKQRKPGHYFSYSVCFALLFLPWLASNMTRSLSGPGWVLMANEHAWKGKSKFLPLSQVHAVGERKFFPSLAHTLFLSFQFLFSLNELNFPP